MANNTIRTRVENCESCNRCISACPIYANKMIKDKNNHIKVDIINERCIQCAECIKVCKHNARHFVDDTEQFFNDVKKYDMAVIIAPSLLHNFKDYKNLIGYLKSIGVNLVYDISFGADITTWAYLKLYEHNINRSVIAQPCPVIVNYIEHYEPSLIQYLAPVHSPTLCAAIYLKKYKNFSGRIAMFSPCIAKEIEFVDPNTNNFVHYNVTATKIKEYLEKHRINLSNYEEQEFDNVNSNLGFTFSRPGGLKENVDFYTNSALWIKQVEGIHHDLKYLKEFKKRISNRQATPQLVDMLNCPHGCNHGTGTNEDIEFDDIDYATNQMKKQFLTDDEQRKADENAKSLFAVFDNELNPEDFRRHYSNKQQSIKDVSTKKHIDPVARASEVERIYEVLDKDTESKRNHNCDACGFHTCNNFVNAVVSKKAEVEACFFHSNATIHRSFNEIKQQLNVNLTKVESKIHAIDENQSTLHDIARNINLISINASIEAASAGQYGKGFNVVATEIKKLADKSKNVMVATSKSNNEIKEQLSILKTELIDKLLTSDKLITE
ncbi:MAG: methyl-accepting chemotaxis protein [Bacteroidetes bacterium]|nr:methyl-accepting chemotaxis protein [Bacteroidota bacterium]